MDIFEQFQSKCKERKETQEQIDALLVEKNKLRSEEDALWNKIEQLSTFTIVTLGDILAYIVSKIEGATYAYKEIYYSEGCRQSFDNAIIREDIIDCKFTTNSNLPSNPLATAGLAYYFEVSDKYKIINFYNKFSSTRFEYLNDFINMLIDAKYQKVREQLPSIE